MCGDFSSQAGLYLCPTVSLKDFAAIQVYKLQKVPQTQGHEWFSHILAAGGFTVPSYLCTCII